jgi:hypothetical protein
MKVLNAAFLAAIMSWGFSANAHADKQGAAINNGEFYCAAVLNPPSTEFRGKYRKPAGFDVDYCKDPELVGQVLSTMQLLAEEDMTMICVTREMGFACDVGDRIAYFVGVSMEEAGLPEQILKNSESEYVNNSWQISGSRFNQNLNLPQPFELRN